MNTKSPELNNKKRKNPIPPLPNKSKIKQTEKPKQKKTRLNTKKQTEKQKPKQQNYLKRRSKGKKVLNKRSLRQTTLNFNKTGKLVVVKPQEAPNAQEQKLMPESLTIVTFNVNGLRSSLKNGDMKQTLLSLDADLLCLQETKTVERVLQLEGYADFWSHSTAKKGYSGTAIFTRYKPTQIKYSVLSMLGEKWCRTHPNIAEHVLWKEGRFLALEFETFWLINTYVPNSGSDLQRIKVRTEIWDFTISQLLIQIDSKKPLIWCGDLNVAHQQIDVYDPSALGNSSGFTNQERQSFSNILQNKFVDIFRKIYPLTENKYTFWSMRQGLRFLNKGWRIDYFVTSLRIVSNVKTIEILDNVYGSDHCPVKISFKHRQQQPKEQQEVQQQETQQEKVKTDPKEKKKKQN
ncbi:DNA-(apurinic or apyrimidinic site) lyase [Anaeramoeba flamelloides]|uniref:DNA-(apurinic or apyrimidinic site) endonuclease n=1 Tax=Anaeramoeba flamelloides TaxID=1746091 RepID=A0AAV8A4I3_9EUKA|nr:DNA-(apurinic or apyrimidinic site) lyase [Anaeramoeba flamelloides]